MMTLLLLLLDYPGATTATSVGKLFSQVIVSESVAIVRGGLYWSANGESPATISELYRGCTRDVMVTLVYFLDCASDLPGC